MRNLLILASFLLLSLQLQAQPLSGEYFIQGQGGEIVLRLESAGGQQIGGTLTDMQGTVYQVQATEENGQAFGTLQSPQEGVYFRAFRQGAQLHLTLIPADVNGQPNAAGGQEFVLNARGSMSSPLSVQPAQTPKQQMNMGGPLGGQASADQWGGSYSGQIAGTATTVKLTQQGNNLNGQVNAGGYMYQLKGTVSAQQAQGQLLDPQTQGSLPFTAGLQGGQLTLNIQSPGGGPSQSAVFTKGGAAPSGASPAPPGQSQQQQQAYERDSRLVGNWNYTDSYTSGDYSFATQWKLIINGDGSYIHGDGRVIGGGPGISGDSGSGGDVTRGQWRTQNGIIYVNTGAGWEAYCRYTTDGSSLLMQFGDGSKQLWKRSG